MKLIMSFVALFVMIGTHAALLSASEEQLYTYKVYGQNQNTGLMVAGELKETDKDGNLSGKIYDKFSVQRECNGLWVGYGVAKVGCENGQNYIVRVVEK